MDEEQYQEPQDQVEKVFEDDKVLIVSPLTNTANRYYGLKSPWYEESWSGTREFERRLESGGKIYYIVNKESGEKDSFYKDQYGILWYNSGSKMGEKDVNDLIEFAPSAKNAILNITSRDTFKKLRQFAKGQIDATTLENSDDLIYDVRVNKDSLGDSQVVIRFDDDEQFFNMLDLNDDDIWFVNAVMARDYEFRSYDQMWEDNKEGYGIFRYFNDENLEKLKKIALVVMPSEDFEPQNESYMGQLYLKLYDTFSRQLDDMDYRYLNELNQSSSENARKEIENEFRKYLSKKGFSLDRMYDRISTTVGELVYLYSLKGRKRDDLQTLLESELKPENSYEIGGWGNDYYEYESNNDIDFTYLNSKFEDELDWIIEKLEEDTDMVEYFRLTERLAEYKLNTWYETPKDKNILFQIKKIDPNTLRIQVNLRKKDSRDWDKTHYFTEENFNNFLHQPELFSIFDEK